jgi:hypothetical protein
MSASCGWAEGLTAVASVLAAVGTVGALVAAFVQIANERTARRRLANEADQRDRRAQAELVSAWYDRDIEEAGSLHAYLTLSNRSDAPVYQAVATLVIVRGAGPVSGREVRDDASRSVLWNIPPGRMRTVVSGGWAGMSRVPAGELAFTDAAGHHWLRRADGRLGEIDRPAADYYKLDAPPAGWSKLGPN